MSTIERNLTEGNLLASFWGFFAPLFLSHVLQLVYSVVDMAVVGRFAGTEGLAAVSVCGDLIHVLNVCAMGFGNAGQILISRGVGTGDRAAVSRMIGTLLSTVLLIAAVCTVLALVFADGILQFVNMPAEAQQEAEAYFLTSACGLVFIGGYNAASAVLRGLGDSRHPLAFIALSSGLNIALDLFLIAGLGLGAFGAAVATVIAQAVSFFACYAFLYRNRDSLPFDFRPASFRISRPELGRLLALGLPMAMQFGFIQISKLIVLSWINVYGVEASAITGIGNKINSIGIAFSASVAASSSVMISRCLGGGQTEKVPKIVGIAAGFSLAICGAIAAAVLLSPDTFFHLFTEDPAVLSMTDVYAPVVAVMLLAAACRSPMNGIVNGSGRGKLNLLNAVLDGICGHIGLSALLGFGLGLGLTGLWYGNALAGFVAFFVGFIYFLSGRWRDAAARPAAGGKTGL